MLFFENKLINVALMVVGKKINGSSLFREGFLVKIANMQRLFDLFSDSSQQMESIQQNDDNHFMEHASNDPPNSPDINDIVGDRQLDPRLGHEYQVEVPSLIKQSERSQLLINPADSEAVPDNSLSFAIGLPISVTWIEDSGHGGWGNVGNIEGKIHAVEPADAVNAEKNSTSDNGEELKSSTYLSGMTGDSNSSQLDKSKNYVLAPVRLNNSWSDADTKSFVLGLYIFGKNFIQIKRFLENKGMGEILSFYYGKFYKSDGYRRWSDCRKMKGRKCLIGEKLFTGLRQRELLSRLIPHVSEESQDTLLQVAKSYVESSTSLEEYITFLKFTVGLSVLVEAVGIGKEKGDLTTLAVEPKKKNRAVSAPASKDWSSLGPSDITKYLTGGFRLSKSKSNDLFWDAVWPRLLARGWHSEQPKKQGYVSSKDCLVFLVPGIKKFSRRKLVKGDHYFDSVSDVLSKVAAEPNLLYLEEEAKVSSCEDEEQGEGSNEDDQPDYHGQCYLKPPRTSTYNADCIKFMVVDTSLVHGGKSSDLRELKSLPVNAAGVTYKDMSANIDKKLTKFTVIDTSMRHEGKLLTVRGLRYLPVELEDASKMPGVSSSTESSSSDDDSLSVVEVNMPIHDRENNNNTDSCQKGKSDCDTVATNQEEAYDNADENANKMVESQKNQKACVTLQFSRRRARSDHSNHAVMPIKRRRLTACAKAETSRVIEIPSGGLGSEKLAFSQSIASTDAHENVGDPVGQQQNQSLDASSADRSVEENTGESILIETCQCMNVPCAEVEKCESQLPVNFNLPQVPPKPENGEMKAMMEEDVQCQNKNGPSLSSVTKEVVEEPMRTSSDVSSMEQQPAINPRRQSTRNRPLSVRALESLANEFLHLERRQKRKSIQTNKDPVSPCRKSINALVICFGWGPQSIICIREIRDAVDVDLGFRVSLILPINSSLVV
ncbi:hypothetical protein RJT34_19105 [Clitoria ternatea]|uniref:SANT domain-containing protein n=1 Tax=Clitoria ternatea TaxID=43366 RepID=A0AAN9P363_CLITE